MNGDIHTAADSASSPSVSQGGEQKIAYEMPTLVALGNVREIVAQVSGPYYDADADALAQAFP